MRKTNEINGMVDISSLKVIYLLAFLILACIKYKRCDGRKTKERGLWLMVFLKMCNWNFTTIVQLLAEKVIICELCYHCPIQIVYSCYGDLGIKFNSIQFFFFFFFFFPLHKAASLEKTVGIQEETYNESTVKNGLETFFCPLSRAEG